MRLFFFLIVFASPLLEAQHPADQAKGVVVISHRGEHLQHPENTMPAFIEAVRVRADYIEVDVRTTFDGKLVLMHDADFGRTTTGKGAVSSMTFDETRSLDAGVKRDIAFTGTKVPTFDEVLDYARGKIGVYVDCKAISPKDLVEHINAHGMTDQVVIYSGRMSKEVQQIDPRLKIMPEARNAEFAKTLVTDLHVRVMAFDAADFKPEVIAVAKQGKAQIFVDRLGAADNPAAWAEAVQWGATGIQTDHPEELVKFLREKGYHK
jgi:glycerophosphoryl diester phosphodiesterase